MKEQVWLTPMGDLFLLDTSDACELIVSTNGTYEYVEFLYELGCTYLGDL